MVKKRKKPTESTEPTTPTKPQICKILNHLQDSKQIFDKFAWTDMRQRFGCLNEIEQSHYDNMQAIMSH